MLVLFEAQLNSHWQWIMYNSACALIASVWVAEEKEGVEKGEKKTTPVSQFGSITATLVDGMVLSLSQWGATGQTAEGTCIVLCG